MKPRIIITIGPLALMAAAAAHGVALEDVKPTAQLAPAVCVPIAPNVCKSKISKPTQ